MDEDWDYWKEQYLEEVNVTGCRFVPAATKETCIVWDPIYDDIGVEARKDDGLEMLLLTSKIERPKMNFPKIQTEVIFQSNIKGLKRHHGKSKRLKEIKLEDLLMDRRYVHHRPRLASVEIEVPSFPTFECLYSNEFASEMETNDGHAQVRKTFEKRLVKNHSRRFVEFRKVSTMKRVAFPRLCYSLFGLQRLETIPPFKNALKASLEIKRQPEPQWNIGFARPSFPIKSKSGSNDLILPCLEEEKNDLAPLLQQVSTMFDAPCKTYFISGALNRKFLECNGLQKYVSEESNFIERDYWEMTPLLLTASETCYIFLEETGTWMDFVNEIQRLDAANITIFMAADM